MKKRILSVFLALVMTFALSVSAFATTYPDLTNHWAKTYMEDLAAKGYITGYSDGTMKPDKNIAAGEMLVVLSRLYTLTDLQISLIQSDYEATVKGIVSSDLSWEYKYLEICLATGIISKDELKSLNLTADIQKENLALYLIRAMQLTPAANKLSSSDLTFADSSKILSACAGAVAELKIIGIISGDASNKFSPQASVTRAVASTMVSRALTYMSSNNITLAITAYSGMTQKLGIITAVGSGTVDVRGFDGLIREYAILSSTDVSVNNAAGTLTSDYVGSYAKLTCQNGAVKSLGIVSDSSSTWVQGTITSANVTTASCTITMRNIDTGNISQYSIPSSATVTLDGKTSTIANLGSSSFISLKYSGGTVTEADAVTTVSTISGTVSTLTLASTVILKVSDSDGNLYFFQMDMASMPTITRASKTITIDKLNVGDSVSLTFSAGKVSAITVAGTGSTVTGVLVSTTISTDGTVWTLAVDGSKTTYSIDSDVTVYSGTKQIKLSDVDIGSQVTVTLYGSTITEISVEGTTTSATKVTGTVLSVSTTNRQIAIMTATNKLIYINTGSLVSIVSGATGNAAYLTDITKNATITAYGTYSDSTTFTVKLIVIE